jgi:hypothetical protein
MMVLKLDFTVDMVFSRFCTLHTDVGLNSLCFPSGSHLLLGRMLAWLGTMI